jgi:RNA polymerase sigma-70 factor (family 1)
MKEFPLDGELISMLQKGDIGAFDLIYEKYSGRLYAFSFKYLKSVEEAEELVQSVFLKVWENHKLLRQESSFKSFLFTIAYNEICNLFRRKAYLRRYMDEKKIENLIESNDTAEQIEYQSLLQQIETIIAKLPEKQRIIFQKSRKEGKSSREIAEELDLSTGTIDNYISESICTIRKGLNETNLSAALFFALFFSR